jgi:hypothetical protein
VTPSRGDHEVLDPLARAVTSPSGRKVRQHGPPLGTARCLEPSRAKRAALVAHPLQRLRDAILEPEVFVEPATAASFGGAARVPSSHAQTAL